MEWWDYAVIISPRANRGRGLSSVGRFQRAGQLNLKRCRTAREARGRQFSLSRSGWDQHIDVKGWKEKLTDKLGWVGSCYKCQETEGGASSYRNCPCEKSP